MTKYLPIILFAMCIDGLQALLSFACLTMGSALGLIPGVIFVSAPLGIALGIACDICVSLTFGVILVLMLSFFGMFYPGQLLSGTLFEFLPGLDVLPGWTAMTVMCVLRKRKEEGKLTGSASSAFGNFLSPKTAVGRAYGGIQSVQQKNVAMMRGTRMPRGGRASDTLIRTQRIRSRQQLKKNLTAIDGITPGPKTASSVRSRTNYAV